VNVKFYRVEDEEGMLTDWQRAAVIVETDLGVRVYTEISTARGKVKCFLRSMRDSSSYTWDTFGDDFVKPERALDALMNANNPSAVYIAQQMLARDLLQRTA
jgi:hypothetical protein